MKRSRQIACLMLLTLLLSIPVLANKTIEAPIQHVTLFPNQAQITRICSLDLIAGKHTVSIDKLPITIINESFRASISDLDGVSLLGLNHKDVQHLLAPSDELALLEEKIFQLENEKLHGMENNLEAFEEQKRILNSLSNNSGNWSQGDSGKVNLDVQGWMDAYNFIGNNLRDINDSIRIISNDIIKLRGEIHKYKTDLRNISSPKNHTTKTVTIDLLLDKPMSFELSLKYNLPGASWQPLYDARLTGDSSVKMICYADINQQTGEDWSDITMTISTARPTKGIDPGDLPQWFLTAFEYKKVHVRGGRSDEMASASVISVGASKPGVVSDKDELNYGTGMNLVTGGYAVNFECQHRTTIASGNETEKIFITDWDLTSDLDLLCRPRNREAIFRQALVTNQDDSPLLPGMVSIFAAGDFLGKSFITDVIAPGEKFKIGFGIDDGIKVKRELVSVVTEHDNNIFSGDKIKKKQTIKVKLINNKTTATTISLEEVLPISRDDRIVINFGDIQPQFDKIDDDGKADWSIKLDPGQETTVTIPVEIVHGNDIQISGL